MITLAVLTSGRMEYLEQTIQSFEAQVRGSNMQRLIFDDSGSWAYSQWLRMTFPGYQLASSGENKGYANAIAGIFDLIQEGYLFLLEEDFVFERPVDLDLIREVMECNPYLAQMSLLRQAWSAPEVEAGGVIQQDPSAFQKAYFCPVGRKGVEAEAYPFFRQRKYFTTNPSLIPPHTYRRGWPLVEKSEAKFSSMLFHDPEVYCGIWGEGTPWVTHIGVVRKGHGY